MKKETRFPKHHSAMRPAAKRQLGLLAALVLIALLICLPLIPTRLISADTGTGSISLTTLDSAIPTETFNTLSNTAGSTTNTALPTGWYITEGGGGARDNEQYAVDTGASTTGDTYSYGTAGSTDRALGELRSGTLIPLFGAKFTNNTGATITSLDVSYTGEQWRFGGVHSTVADRLDFQYSVNATDLSTGTYLDANALDFNPPITAGTAGALDGNAAANRTAISSTITGLSIPAGATFFIRFNDVDATGADDGLAIDDFSVTPHGASVQPNLTINDVSLNEGNAGTTTFTFTVSLSSAAPGDVTFDIATADGTATQPSDYTQKSLTSQTIPQGSMSYTFDVLVNGDTTPETNETFFVNVTNATGANVTDGQGQGTIVNDDAAPNLTINDVSLNEGNAGTTTFTFTVSLSSAAPAGGVTFDIATADGTATQPSDYTQKSLTSQTIPQGSMSYTFDVLVNGDTTPETNETFFVNVTNIVNAIGVDTQGQGTILNDDFTPIHNIQGNGAVSPLVGQVVTTRGIVTGVKSNGFFIQDPMPDADPATSEGVFVFTSSAPPAAAAVGNYVEVTATVSEFVPSADPLQPPLTELSSSPAVTLLTSGNPLPAPVLLTATFPDPAGPFDQLERLEGMRVSVASLTVCGPTQGTVNEPNASATSNGVFYGVVTGVARPFREPGIQAPDPPPSGSIPPIPRFDTNPERIRVDSDVLTGAPPPLDVAAGAVVTGLTGPLDYAFRTYTIDPDPTAEISATGGMTPTPVTAATASEFTVASFNLERFFDTVNDPNIGEPVLTAAAFDKRLAKASLAIRNYLLMPDIIGVEEMENLSTLQALAARISSDAVAASQPDPQYSAHLVEGNDVGGIDVGFLVKTAPVVGKTPRVTVNAVVQELKNTLFVNPDSSTALLNDRPPLRLMAVVNYAGGQTFPVTVIVNHLRSLNGVDDNSAGSNGWPTEGDRVRAKRQKQAEDLANLVQARQVADPNERIILVGDFNAFEVNDGYVDSMHVIAGTPSPDNETVVPGDGVDLVNPDFTNLFSTPPPAERYSYNFDGNAQTLDHILVNAALISATGTRREEHARIDSDFPETARNDGTTPTRISDHDPVVSYFTASLNSTPVAKCKNVTVSAGADCTANASIDDGSFDPDKGDTITVTQSPAGPYPKGMTTVTLTVTDNHQASSSCMATVTVNDTTPPTLTCPANISTNTDPNQCSAVVKYAVPMAMDNCPGVGTVVCMPASGSTFQKGTTTVTCSVSDASGNPARCSFTVTVSDAQPPTITCPANITKSTDPNACTAVVMYPTPTVSDNCSNLGSPMCSPASGSTFPKGTTTVNCSVTDGSGNTASCSFTVTVNDTQPPTITCPANITTKANTINDACKVVAYTTPTGSDNCPGVTVACSPASGSCFAVGTTTVTCTATDASGNTATCSFSVSVFNVCVQDDSNPSIVFLGNSKTGDYRFCCGGTTFTGKAKVTIAGNLVTFEHNATDRKVLVRDDEGAFRATGSLQTPPGTTRCTITDRDTRNNTCICQ